jgi:predicted DNA-binding protein with PD1-like motif
VEQACRQHKVKTAVLVSAAGMLAEVELRAFIGNGKYANSSFSEPMELVSATGTAALQADGSYAFHIHATLADHRANAFGGHLGAGKVKVTNELVFLLSASPIIRRKEEETGLMGMFFE